MVMNLFCYYCLIITSLILMIAVDLTLAFKLRRPDTVQRYTVVNLTVRAVGSTVFDVEWLPPKEEKEQERKEEGTVNASAYYMLTYTARLVSEVRFTEGNNFTLTELNECTAYAIAVRRAYGIGENTQFGPASSSILITSRDSPLNAVNNVTVDTTRDSVSVTWENPIEQQPCTAHFHLSLTTADATFFTQAECCRYTAATPALEPCGAYGGHVAAIDFSGARGRLASFNFTTHPAVFGPVSKLSAYSNDSQSIFVSWDKPTNAPLCVHKYEVAYCYDGIVCSTTSTQKNFSMIVQLKACVTYQIIVTPKTVDSVSGISAKTEVTVIAEVSAKPTNGRVLFSTNYTATLQWDLPTDVACGLTHQIVNCSYLNTSLTITVRHQRPGQVTVDRLKPSTKHACYSVFFYREGRSARSDEIIFWTKPTVPSPPTSLSTIKVTSNKAIVTWTLPGTTLPATVDGYRWTVTFKHFLYELPKHCRSQTENDTVTYYVKNYQTNEHEIRNLMPASCYTVGLSASTESGFGNSTNITIYTLPSVSSPIEDLKVTSIKSNLVILNWKYPCVPNGKVAFFHSTLVGERVGHHNHIFSIKFDISENETEFTYSLTNLLPEYRYLCTVVAITYNVEIAGQDNRIRFVTPSTNPNLPTKYDTYRHLKVTKTYLTHVRLSISDNFFSNANGDIQYYSIIVYQDGGFPDKPEHGNVSLYGVWPPVMKTWAEAAPYPFILAYQTTPDQWMPVKGQKDTFFYDIGADESCRIDDVANYCNGPLRPVTNYRLKLRAYTTNGFQDSWTVRFTTPGESTAVYYLVLCSVLFAVLITVSGMYCMLNKKVPWIVEHRSTEFTTTESGVPGDMTYKRLLTVTSRDVEVEYNLLNVYPMPGLSMDVAALPENKFKNRYIDALPYDRNRVIVGPPGNNGYINASFVQDSKGVRRYIACQGPMKNTSIDMWQMVLDQNVVSIVMLCQTTENNKIKCEQYFPNSNEKLIFGDIQIKNDMIVNEKHFFTTRILTVSKGSLKKTIRHFHFHDWPDFGIPDDHSTLVQFCLMVQAKSSTGIIVVHCSAGVGRTGTYIACDMLLRQLQEGTTLNVFKTVFKLREQRTNMVQTLAQYEFVYGLLTYYIKKYLQIKSSNTETNNHSDSTPVNQIDASTTQLI